MSRVLKTAPAPLYPLALFLLGSLLLTDLHAQGDCDRDINDRVPCGGVEEEWRESEVTIPPITKDSDFRILDVTEADARYRYFLAESSITRGTDNVMRYVVAVVSGNGVRNVFYEGLRCETDEIKIYAYASKRGTFRPASNTRWRPVQNKGVRAYQDFLTQGIICDTDGFAWPAEKARQALLRQFTAGGFRRGVCRICD